MSGFLIQWWARPFMTVASLIWAFATTGYILLGNMLEERDIVIMVPGYRDYCRRTRAYFPMCPMPNPLLPSGESADESSKKRD